MTQQDSTTIDYVEVRHGNSVVYRLENQGLRGPCKSAHVRPGTVRYPESRPHRIQIDSVRVCIRCVKLQFTSQGQTVIFPFNYALHIQIY